jgi:hypothetical protein
VLLHGRQIMQGNTARHPGERVARLLLSSCFS